MFRTLFTLGLCCVLGCAHASGASPVPPARVVELPARQLGPDQRAELRRNVLAEQGKRAQQAQQDEELRMTQPRQLNAQQKAQLRQLLREQAASPSSAAPPSVRR